MKSWINDPRDAPFLSLMAQCFLVIGLAISLFFAGAWFWPMVLVYLIAVAMVMDRLILMLHCTSHRPLFNKDHAWMNEIIPALICPFFGQTPYSYFVHHIGMHHIEDNMPTDLSSTMRYQRDSIFGWLHYVGTFLTIGLFQLGRYHWRRGTKKLFWRLVIAESLYWSSVAILFAFNPRATALVFMLPVLVIRLLMMAGNWGQHAFIDPTNPAESWRSSITCINTPYNTRCFNDGYHTMHHKKPRMHWTEYPNLLKESPETYGKEDALVFDGLDFFQIWLLLMLHRHEYLAKRIVRLPGAPSRTDAEMVELMKTRLKAFPKEALVTA